MNQASAFTKASASRVRTVLLPSMVFMAFLVFNYGYFTFILGEHITYLIYFQVFFTASIMVYELSKPLFSSTYGDRYKYKRWLSNLSLGFFVGQITVGLCLSFAVYAQEQLRFGIFYQLECNIFLKTVLCVVALDLAGYLQHRLQHVTPFLWRFHQVHHSDEFLDFTTTGRLHMVDVFITLLMRCVVILLFGFGTIEVTAAVIAPVLIGIFNHGNIKMPIRLEQALAKVVITPRLHVIHHSCVMQETNSNYGLVFSFWDKLFGSFTNDFSKNDLNHRFGLSQYFGKNFNFFQLIALPFRRRQK